MLYKLTPYNGVYEKPFFLDCGKLQLNPTSLFDADSDPSIPKHKSLYKSGFSGSSPHKTHLLATRSNSEYSMITFHTLISTDLLNILVFLAEKTEISEITPQDEMAALLGPEHRVFHFFSSLTHPYHAIA